MIIPLHYWTPSLFTVTYTLENSVLWVYENAKSDGIRTFRLKFDNRVRGRECNQISSILRSNNPQILTLRVFSEQILSKVSQQWIFQSYVDFYLFRNLVRNKNCHSHPSGNTIVMKFWFFGNSLWIQKTIMNYSYPEMPSALGISFYNYCAWWLKK